VEVKSFSDQGVLLGCNFGGQDPQESTDAKILRKYNLEP
jgi:hypothetical protein